MKTRLLATFAASFLLLTSPTTSKAQVLEGLGLALEILGLAMNTKDNGLEISEQLDGLDRQIEGIMDGEETIRGIIDSSLVKAELQRYQRSIKAIRQRMESCRSVSASHCEREASLSIHELTRISSELMHFEPSPLSISIIVLARGTLAESFYQFGSNEDKAALSFLVAEYFRDTLSDQSEKLNSVEKSQSEAILKITGIENFEPVTATQSSLEAFLQAASNKILEPKYQNDVIQEAYLQNGEWYQVPYCVLMVGYGMWHKSIKGDTMVRNVLRGTSFSNDPSVLTRGRNRDVKDLKAHIIKFSVSQDSSYPEINVVNEFRSSGVGTFLHPFSGTTLRDVFIDFSSSRHLSTRCSVLDGRDYYLWKTISLQNIYESDSSEVSRFIDYINETSQSILRTQFVIDTARSQLF